MGAKKKDSTIIHKVLDGEASKSETRTLQKKLKEDPTVKAEFDSLKKVTDITKKLEDPESSPEFRKKVLRKMHEQK